MTDSNVPKKRGRKPAPNVLAAAPVADAPAIPAPLSSPAALAAVIEAPVQPAIVVEPAAALAEPAAALAEPVEAYAEIAPEPAPEPVAPEPEPAPQPEIVSAAAEPLQEGPAKMATTYDAAATTEAAAGKAKAMFGDFNDRAKSAMEKSVKLGEEMTEFTKGNVEALVASGRVAAKGAETMAQDVAETMKKHFETTTSTMKSFAAVKSPTELFQLQSDYAKSYFDGAVADASKFSEQVIKLWGDIAQPLSSRYALAAEKLKTSAL